MSRSLHRPRLGRGLSSLIRNSTAEDGPEYQPATESARPTAIGHRAMAIATANVLMIPVNSIGPNPYQPRRQFEKQSLGELADSIRGHGLLQPIVVAEAPAGEGDRPYRLIAGERRLRAAELAGLAEVPCMLRHASSREMLELSLIENLRRADLNPIERATGYRDLMDRFDMTQQQVAERMGDPRATVANYLRLLELCDTVQSLVTAGSISFGHAKVLAGLAGMTEIQDRLARKVAEENLSVRRLEELVRAAQRGELPDEAVRKTQMTTARPAYLIDIERQLTQAVGSKVTIRPGRAKNRGRIVIEYYGLDDFDRIVSALGAKIES